MELGFHPPGIDHQGLDKESLKRSFLEWLVYSVGKDPKRATRRDWFASVALAVRDRVVDRWMETSRAMDADDRKRVYYLSLEFLIGRLLHNNMSNLGIVDVCREALEEIGIDIATVIQAEPDQALGNGGLGRLAACFLDSMATLGIAGYGYGIRYEYGMFEQRFDHGFQVESPENWLETGNPWEFERPEVSYPIDFYGHVEEYRDSDGEKRHGWVNTERVKAVAYDTPVVGWRGRRINTLRLWSAKPTNEFNLADFNSGNYLGAVEQKVLSENLSRVLYPNDSTEVGQELRFKQEYFFTSASLQDILRRYVQQHPTFDRLPEKAAIQLNDTHPAIAVPELMRLLIDAHRVSWAKAWELTRATIAYTNHTLLPEALEAWPVGLVERVLPRHMQIIYEINARFLTEARKKPITDNPRLATLSLIDEDGDRRVRMGNLAFLGSHKVNGVSALHTDLMKQTVFKEMNREFPDRIVNKTNGITPRRWLHQCNRPLAALVTEAIGDGWMDDLERISDLAPHAEDSGFREAFFQAKRRNKEALAGLIADRLDVAVDPDALFDVQIKRIHEYKRQFLNLIQTVALYNQIRDNPTVDWVPRVKIFGGKAASSYDIAKLIIKLGNDIAHVVNQDPAVRGLLKVVFLPNYNVTLAEKIIPAADLSEQISTAGKEASGTGNMKFALNGALTIGTLDGANVEIMERVGADNIFIFGLKADEVEALRAGGEFDPGAVIDGHPALRRALDMIASGVFSPDDPYRFRPLTDGLRHHDSYFVTADFAAYQDAQKEVGRNYVHREDWLRKAVLNTANVGWFSSDRTIRDYAREIWQAMPPMAEAAE
ncbi:glycogen/starch/alpha-glucan phosphorylase [Inquilinus sp. CAU 1745]|uniref:glycogen/starch/alpha-glucan phosphorylase n=1 Tax=Inquilinus sp. CAU 1745 TaxID=3140369 RepID=UPI00325BB6BC